MAQSSLSFPTNRRSTPEPWASPDDVTAVSLSRSPIAAVSRSRPSGGRAGLESPRHVVEMVHGVVDEVAGKRLDREAGAVAAVARAPPGVPRHGVEPVGDPGGVAGDVGSHLGGILLVVAVVDRGRVLVPVGKVGAVLGE